MEGRGDLFEPKRYRTRVGYVINGDTIILEDVQANLRLWGV